MATPTLELVDSGLSETLNLVGSTYKAMENGARVTAAPADFQFAGTEVRDVLSPPKIMDIILKITGTTVSDLTNNIQVLERMLERATRRRTLGHGTDIVLKYQLDNSDDNVDISVDVLGGRLHYASSIMNSVLTSQATPIAVNARLELTLKPFGYLPTVVYGKAIRENEIDGNNVNFIDIAGRFGSRLTFDGATGDVQVADASEVQNIFDSGGAIAWRMKANSDGESSNGSVWDKDLAGTDGHKFFIRDESAGVSKAQFTQRFSGTVGAWVTTNTVFTNGQLYFCGLNYDNDATGNNPTLYIIPINADGSLGTTLVLTVGDGLTETSTPVGTRSDDTGNDLWFGNDSSDGVTFDGDLDEISIWSSVRTQTQLETYAAAELNGDESGLLGLWHFNENVGTLARDSTSAGNDGTLNNSPAWKIDDFLAGTGGALVQVKIEDTASTWSTSDSVWLAVRTGERYADTVFLSTPASITETDDPVAGDVSTFVSSVSGGGFTTNAHKGATAELSWDFQSNLNDISAALYFTGYFQFDIAAGSIPKGKYRVLARVAVDDALAPAAGTMTSAEMKFALGYAYGGVTFVPSDIDDVTAFISAGDDKNAWRTLDIGSIDLLPIEGHPDITETTMNIRVYAVLDLTGNALTDVGATTNALEYYVDHIMLVPVDDGVAIHNGLDTSREWTISNIDTAGMWDELSSVFSRIPDAVGDPGFSVGIEKFRLYWLKADTGDPSSVKSIITVKDRPLVFGL